MLAASDNAVTLANADARAPTGAQPQQLSDNMVPCFLCVTTAVTRTMSTFPQAGGQVMIAAYEAPFMSRTPHE